jgi:hypothetical protein
MATGITTSSNATWDAARGIFVTTITLESFTGSPDYPADALDVTKSYTDGKWTVTYKTAGDATGGPPLGTTSASYNYSIHSSLSTEPLATAKIFTTGTYALTSDDLERIKDAEADPSKWSFLASSTSGLGKYAQLILKGQDSYLNPTLTLTITSDEATLPDLTLLGTIVSIPNAPSVPAGANWLLAGCNCDAITGGKWRVTREYRLSGRNGWNSLIYAAS